MKKLICLLIVVSMLLSTSFAYAESNSELFSNEFMTLLDHAGKMNGWKEELNAWFADYKARIDDGEVLSSEEMNVIFAYVDLAIDMTYVYLAEGTLLAKDGDSSVDTELRDMVDDIKTLYDEGLITQGEYIESVSPIFESLITK